VKIRWNLF